MPRLRNSLTGAVVNVDDDTAARLGAEWESAEGKDSGDDPKKPTTRRKSSAKSDDDE